MGEVISTMRTDNTNEPGRGELTGGYRLPTEPVASRVRQTLNNQDSILPANNTCESCGIWSKVRNGLRMEKEETILAQKRSRAGRQLSSQSCGRVRDLVAVKAGFKSANSYVAAKTVYLNAHHEIKKLVDDQIIKITPAAKLARIEWNDQVKAAKIIRLMQTGMKNPKRAVSSFINNLVKFQDNKNECFLKNVSDKIRNGDTSLKQMLDNCTVKNIDNSLKNKKIENNPLQKISGIYESLSELVILNSEIALLDEKRVVDLDKKLSHIEKISKNFRNFLREKSSFFDDSFNDSVNHYRSQFIETVQFFAHSLVRNLNKTDEALLSDLHRTFHNSTTILYNVAAVTARQIRY